MRPNLRITSLVPSEDDFRRREVPYSTSSKFPEPTSEFLVGPGHDASGTRAALGTGVGCAFADPVLLILHHQDHHQGVGGLHDTYSATLSQSELSAFPPVAEKGRFPPVIVVGSQSKITPRGLRPAVGRPVVRTAFSAFNDPFRCASLYPGLTGGGNFPTPQPR